MKTIEDLRRIAHHRRDAYRLANPSLFMGVDGRPFEKLDRNRFIGGHLIPAPDEDLTLHERITLRGSKPHINDGSLTRYYNTWLDFVLRRREGTICIKHGDRALRFVVEMNKALRPEERPMAILVAYCEGAFSDAELWQMLSSSLLSTAVCRAVYEGLELVPFSGYPFRKTGA